MLVLLPRLRRSHADPIVASRTDGRLREGLCRAGPGLVDSLPRGLIDGVGCQTAEKGQHE